MPDKDVFAFTPKTLETAEPRAKASLQEAKTRIGEIPNIYAMMANSPALLETYTTGAPLFRQSSAFSRTEQEVVYLTISHYNRCRYCVAVHSTLVEGARVDSPVSRAHRAPRGRAATRVDAAAAHGVHEVAHIE